MQTLYCTIRSFLDEEEKNCVKPDVSVICYSNKVDGKGCHGAPDWIIEIVNVYDFEKEIQNGLYSFDDEIPVAIYPGFSIRISDLLE